MEPAEKRGGSGLTVPTGAMKVLCVIPASGGSLGAPLRNLRLLAGKPLLAYTAEAALASKRISRTILSTEDEDVADVGRRCGLDVPFLRPAELARAGQAGLRAVQDAVRRVEEAGEVPDVVCILDPASPFRCAEDIDRSIERLESTGADAVATVVPVPRECHPRAVWLQAPDGTLHPATGGTDQREFPPAFRYDGSVCVVRRDVLMKADSLYGERTVGYVVDPARCVRLDQPEDWGRAERIARLGTHRATTGRIVPVGGPRSKRPADWSAMPGCAPEVCAGVGPLHEGAIASAALLRGPYLEPAWKAAAPHSRESAAPFALREALLPPDCGMAAHEFLDPIPPVAVAARSLSGRVPSVRRIDDEFRAHPELLPDVRVSEAPLMSALAARQIGASGLDALAEPPRREFAGGSHPRPLAVPIEFSERLGKAAARVRPIQPFVIGVAPLGPRPATRVRSRELRAAPPELALFAAQLVKPASTGLAARETLVHTPVFRREGRSLPRATAAAIDRVAVIGTHAAELRGASVLVFDRRLSAAPPALVRGRTRNLATTWLAQSWEIFGQETAAIVFSSLRPEAHGVEWPTALAFLFARPPERPAKAGFSIMLDPREAREFGVPAACLPASAVLRTRLRSAVLRRAPAPPVRPDVRTLASAAPFNGGFPRGSGEPAGSPAFRALLRCAQMPPGVFTYFEIEDHEDFGTWKRAPHYPAHPLEPLAPESGCGLRSRAMLPGAGTNVVFAGPYAGRKAECRPPHEIPLEPGVFLGPATVDLVEMDFGAIAEAGSSRWRLPFKKTATGLFS
jgi:CMP-N,N'-diacetyllegionaminic acid synthase